MKIIPAIDIRRGKVVRLAQGAFDRETIYTDSPLEAAKKLSLPGVEMIHIVDLDGAFSGKPKNLAAVKEIAKAVNTKLELGGGIRDEAAIKDALDAGVHKVVIGTRALEEKFLENILSEFGEKIVIGIDAREGFIYTNGWSRRTDRRAVDLARQVQGAGAKTINYTDISKDGMMEGPNIASLKELLASTELDVVRAGGVSSIEDLSRLKALEKDGLKGVIIGKALYENKIDLKEAVKLCSQKE
jgi:phosphoribosylformimino-5-aminoimidazole carboxamide ribotide isomerase